MEKLRKTFLMELIEKGRILCKGAESTLYKTKFMEMDTVLKLRGPKKYRISRLDEIIRKRRTFREGNLLYEASRKKIKVPKILYMNLKNNFIIMEYIEGDVLRNALIKNKFGNNEILRISRKIGIEIAKLHNINIVHGDLTTANIIIKKNETPYLIDFGLGEKTKSYESKSEDIDIFYRVLNSTHPNKRKMIFQEFIGVYKEHVNNYREIISRYKRIRRMGRYVERKKRKK